MKYIISIVFIFVAIVGIYYFTKPVAKSKLSKNETYINNVSMPSLYDSSSIEVVQDNEKKFEKKEGL